MMARSKMQRGRALACAATLLAPVLTWAQQPAPAAPAGSPSPQTVVTPQSRINVRVYEGFATLGPVYGSRDTPLAVDVGVTLATCPDGNTEVRALDIGGWNYQVSTACDTSAGRGTIRVNAGSAQTAPPAPAPASQPTTIRCDPATWRCAPAP